MKYYLAGYIDHEISNDDHIVYDIESLVIYDGRIDKKTQILSRHHLLSIACCAFVNKKYTTEFFVIKDMKQKSQDEIMLSFIDFIISSSKKIIAEDVLKAITDIDSDIKALDESWSPQKSRLISYSNYLKQKNKIKLFGFNSSRYDLKVMFHPFMRALGKRYDVNKINILKKGESYFSIETCNFNAKDLLIFSSPTDLVGYLKMWTTSCVKGGAFDINLCHNNFGLFNRILFLCRKSFLV